MTEKSAERVLVIGAGGMLGGVLVREASVHFDVVGTSRADFDITEKAKVQRFCRDIKPAVIVLAAGYTDVDGCERDPQLAHKVNVEGTRNVAEAAAQVGAALISVSTDYVFKGDATRPYREDDTPQPISAYGKSKLEGEQVACSIAKRTIIVRSSWLFGKGDKGFIASVLKSVRTNTEIQAVADKWASPTYTVDLSKAICEISRLIVNGTYNFEQHRILHIVNSGACSWYDVAWYIFEMLDVKGVRLKRMRLSDFPFVAQRPIYSALDNARYQTITGQSLRPWQDALGEFIACQNN